MCTNEGAHAHAHAHTHTHTHTYIYIYILHIPSNHNSQCSYFSLSFLAYKIKTGTDLDTILFGKEEQVNKGPKAQEDVRASPHKSTLLFLTRFLFFCVFFSSSFVVSFIHALGSVRKHQHTHNIAFQFSLRLLFFDISHCWFITKPSHRKRIFPPFTLHIYLYKC